MYTLKKKGFGILTINFARMPKAFTESKMRIEHPFIFIVLFSYLLILQDNLICAKPYNMWSSFQSLIPKTETDCDIDNDVETLCQKCAKQTKSNVVYPMCCQNREEAREWCKKYISFGLQEK